MRGNLPGTPAKSDSEEKKSIVLTNPAGLYEEARLLYDKKHVCPVCGKEFKQKSVRTGKAYSEGHDMDLRPKYINIDPIKYYILECPFCGYADMESTYNEINKYEIEELRKNHLKNDNSYASDKDVRDYSEAFTHYKAAMRCDLVRRAGYGKRGYTALYAAWLLRGWREFMIMLEENVSPSDQMSEKEEMKLIKYAYNNFREAEKTEDFPISGIQENTFDYIMAVLSYKLDNIQEAGRYIMHVLRSDNLKPVIRTKAEDFHEMIRKSLKK